MGVVIVSIGMLCLGLAIGTQIAPIPTALGLASAYQEVGQFDLLNDGLVRQKVAAAEKPIEPDIRIPPVAGGRVPVIHRIDTKQSVVFLTIDDGNYKDQSVIAAMKHHKLKATLFLADLFIAHNPTFFNALIEQGSVVENHTVGHDLSMIKHPYGYQRNEICRMNDIAASYYGTRPTLFRPPGGRYNHDTERAVADCGLRATVMWTARIQNGAIEYQDGRTALRPGDVVLMHFRPEFVRDIEAFVAAKNAAHLKVDVLERWIR